MTKSGKCFLAITKHIILFKKFFKNLLTNNAKCAIIVSARKREGTTMNKNTMIRQYRRFSAADGYVLGFEYKHTIYAIMVDEIMPRFMRVEKESSKKGGAQKLQLRITKDLKEQLIRKGATALGGTEILVGQYNKGVEFERIISEMNGQLFRGKENVGFWIEGDLEIDGKQIQVKFNGAQIVVEKTLHRLQKEARAK